MVLRFDSDSNLSWEEAALTALSLRRHFTRDGRSSGAARRREERRRETGEAAAQRADGKNYGAVRARTGGAAALRGREERRRCARADGGAAARGNEGESRDHRR